MKFRKSPLLTTLLASATAACTLAAFAAEPLPPAQTDAKGTIGVVCIDSLGRMVVWMGDPSSQLRPREFEDCLLHGGRVLPRDQVPGLTPPPGMPDPSPSPSPSATPSIPSAEVVPPLPPQPL